MFQPLLDAVRREASGERALGSVRALARFHRVQASPGYDRAAEWLAATLESYGLEVQVGRVAGDGRTRWLGYLMPRGWECTHAAATLLDGAARERLCDYAAEPLSLILRSLPVEGRFPIVAVEDGTEPEHYRGLEVRGRVVLTRGAVQRVFELAVIERGAAGILYDGRRPLPPVRDAFTDPDALTYTSFWWDAEGPRGWGFVISPRTGAGLRERLRDGRALALEATIVSRAFDTTIPLVSAVLGADPRTEDEVLVVSHLCHPQPSANDNASGAAVNLEAARVLRALRGRGEPAPARAVRFLWVPELTGTYAWLAFGERAGREPRGARLVAALNLDMVGEDQEQCGSTLLIEHPPCFAASFAETLLARIREQAVDWVHSYSGPGHYALTRMAEVPYDGGSDHAVFLDPAFGVPCPMLIQWPDRFYHTSHDTPDRCDPGSLALAARCAASYAGFLAASGPAERAWLIEAVGREARRRMLRALEQPEGERGRALAAERLRGTVALASLKRLNCGPGAESAAWDQAIMGARRRLESFHAREIAPQVSGEAEPPNAPARGRRPRRRLGAPLHDQRHLIEGFGTLPPEIRERWRRSEQGADPRRRLHDLAWAACDGRRSLPEIARLVWLEAGRHEPEAIEAFFEWTARLGLSEWEHGEPAPEEETATWKSSAPDTASP